MQRERLQKVAILRSGRHKKFFWQAEQNHTHPPIQEKTGHPIAVQAASTLPPDITSLLSREPSTIREAQESPKWPHWKGALEREMNGQINNGVWVQLERPKSKTVLGPKTLFKRKIGKDGRIEKCKCRFVT